MLEYRIEIVKLSKLQDALNDVYVREGWKLHTLTRDPGGDLFAVLERFIPVTIAEPAADSAISQTAEQTARSTFIPVVLEDDLFDLDAVPTRKRGRPKKQTT